MNSISISKLGKTAQFIYSGFNYTNDNIGNMSFNHELSRELYSRCCDAIEDLQQIKYNILKTGRAKMLLESIESALELCKKYDKKNKIKRFISSISYRKEFQMKHIIIHIYFTELCMSLFLTSEFPNPE